MTEAPVTAHSYDTRLPTRQSSYLTATHVTAHSWDTRLPTWQSSYLTATHVTAHCMILDCRPGSPVTWLSPPTHMIPDCRPGSPVTWQLHVTAHSYDTRLLTWQPSYLTTQLLGLPPKFEEGTRVTARLGYHQGGHLLALLRPPRNTTRRCWPITTTIQTIN